MGVVTQVPVVVAVVPEVDVLVDDVFVVASFLQALNTIGPVAAATAKALKKFFLSISFVIRSTVISVSHYKHRDA